MAKKLEVSKKQRIIEMLCKGISYDTIAIKIDCSLSYVKTIDKQLIKDGNLTKPEIIEPNYLIRSEQKEVQKLSEPVTIDDVRPSEAPQRHFCSVFPDVYADVYAIITHPSGKFSKGYLCDKAIEEIKGQQGVSVEIMPLM